MTDMIEGRWWLDFTKNPPVDPAGNEFVLSGGTAIIAKTGEPAGTYEIAHRQLKLSLPIPAGPGEAPWRIEAKFFLYYPENLPARLTGIIRAFDSDGAVVLEDVCALVRQRADA